MPINRPDKALEVRQGSLDTTSMRYHELWLQRWLYSRFFVREGYPVPVVFATPMDAFSLFSKLWADENNPFAYLFALKDEHGTPLYEPYPSPVRYPLISVMRQGVKLRTYQNFSTHRWRHVNWPTVSDTQEIPGKEQQGNELTKCDLGEVTTSRMPMAFDYKFQIDHFCLRPDTQAVFLERVINQFWRSGGAHLQTWMQIEYPGWGRQYIRIYIDGDIDTRAPDETQFQDKTVEYRTSFTLTVEGFSIDVAYETVPALWKLIFTTASLDQLEQLTEIQTMSATIDLRSTGTNFVLDSRPDIPPSGRCQTDHLHAAYVAAGTQYIYLGDPAVPSLPADNVAVPGPATGGNQPPGFFVIEPQYAWGVESTAVVGIPTIGTLAPVWISGTVTPAAAGIGIELPGSGTLYTSANGSYTGILPYGYTGTAVPHYALAFSFTPPIRTYANVTVSQPSQDYTWVFNLSPWISGTVTPPAASIGVEFPAVGTFAVNATTGSYTGTVPYSYSGTAVPHYWGAERFIPPVRVYTSQIAGASSQDYSYVPVVHYRGTDTFSSTLSLGNISEYLPFNFVNAGTAATSFFGTDMLASVFGISGTSYGTTSTALIGTYQNVTVSLNAGTESGTLAVSMFGTDLLVSFAATAGTEAGTYSGSAFGTYTQVVFPATASAAFFGTIYGSAFGTYAPGS